MDLYDQNFLKSNLCFIYRVIVASCPLLEFAIPKCDGELREYYLQHLDEERDHDVMLKDDLERFGIPELMIPKYHSAAQLAGSQYYLIAHEHPALLLGYMHALEAYSLPPQTVDDLSKHHGVELKTLKHHAIHDPAHKTDLESMICKQDEELQGRVFWNERCVTHFLNGMRYG